MFSETRIPPVSRAAFQVSPKSLRLISDSPSKPKRSFPNGSLAVPVYSNSIVNGFVTSLIVSSPSTTSPAPPSFTDVDLNEIFGKLATSKKSGDWRCPSRSALRVSIEAAEISILIEAAPSATTAEPVYSLNEPRTLVTIAWRALKPTRLCDASMVYVPAGRVERTDINFPLFRRRFTRIPYSHTTWHA